MISNVLIADFNNHSMNIPLFITLGSKTVEPKTLVDSGAGGIFINATFAKKHGFPTLPTPYPIPTYNADGTLSSHGNITRYTWAWTQFGDQKHLLKYLVTSLGDQDVILGLDWLRKYNPSIDWTSGEIKFIRRTYTPEMRFKQLHIMRLVSKFAPPEVMNPHPPITIEEVQDESLLAQSEHPNDPTVLLEPTLDDESPSSLNPPTPHNTPANGPAEEEEGKEEEEEEEPSIEDRL